MYDKVDKDNFDLADDLSNVAPRFGVVLGSHAANIIPAKRFLVVYIIELTLRFIGSALMSRSRIQWRVPKYFEHEQRDAA